MTPEAASRAETSAAPLPPSRARSFPGLLLCLGAFALLKSAFGILICDDAYITLAHARSWNAGLGPVMSAQNPVCATSTPLHTAILALEGAVLRTSGYTSLAYFTNLAWDLAGLFFLHRIASRGLRLPEPFALLALSAYALSVNFLAVSAYGMETPMYTALALAGTWFALYSGRPVPGLAAVAFLAPLARPEGALLPAALILLRGRKAGKTAPALAAAAGLGLFFCFNRYAYGHWLPHSILAKRLEIHVGFLEGLRSWILNVFYKGPCLGGFTLTTLGNLLVLGAAAAGFLRRKARIPWALLAWPSLYFLFFTCTGASYALFTWYYLPVLPFLILFLAEGLRRLAEDRVPPQALRAGLFLFLAYVPAQTFLQGLPRKHAFAEAAREGRYREAARIVDSLAAPGEVPLVMIDEVGAVGYYSRARILDSHGLLSPEALAYLGPADGYFLRMAAMQDRFDPDWILGLRLARDEGRLHPGEDGLFAGYGPVRILRLPPHPYNMEMWRRLAPD
ncbi:MAG TPA: hypothetical protein VJ385_01980 [Fibrobacteria bacterium]|nr:hypothetical protein [Fibrobacteria bacterium]